MIEHGHVGNGNRPRVAVVHDGGRLHYAMPRALQQCGMLEQVFTDWFVRPKSVESLVSSLLARVSPQVGRRMASRRCDELDPRHIRTNPWLALYQPFARRRFESAREFYAWSSERVAAWIRREGFGQADALMGFIRNLDPGLCEDAQRAGLKTIGDQMIAPALVERAEAQLQAERWGDWQAQPSLDEFDGTDALERRTWAALDHITCASEYVRDGLTMAGISPDRISVVPYPIDATQYEFVDRRGRAGPMTVGFVGAVNLRKGAPYFLEVAKCFDPSRVRFVMIGPVQLQAAGEARLRERVRVVGAVPRSDVSRWLSEFDAYLFPSTCEGSAGSIMEAMASGLPIITSPNSGSVVRDGQEGFVSDYADIAAMTTAVRRLADKPEERWNMGEAARRRACEFSLDRYSGELASILTLLLPPAKSTA